MKIILYFDETLDEITAIVADVEKYISLIKKYGYTDIDGMSYIFKSAKIESSFECYIYLDVE